MNRAHTPDRRLHFLDGLRGWAALSVVIYHSTWELFGTLVPGVRVTEAGPLNDGPLAVYIFFVLSGVVLSLPFLRTGDPSRITRMALGRYVRLAVPVTAASLIGLVMMKGGLLSNQAAASVLGGSDWVRDELQQAPAVLSWAQFALYSTFFDYQPQQSYDPYLWTMQIELGGSFALFGVLAIAGQELLTRCIGYIVGTLLALQFAPSILPFFCGVVIAEFITSRHYSRVSLSRYGNMIGCSLFLAGCCASIFLREEHLTPAATLLVLGAVMSPWLQRLLVLPFSVWLGAISFPLYLVHAFIIYGPACWLVLRLADAGVSTEGMMLAVVPFIICLSLLAAWLFLPVERLSITASHWVARMLMRPQRPTERAATAWKQGLSNQSPRSRLSLHVARDLR